MTLESSLIVVQGVYALSNIKSCVTNMQKMKKSAMEQTLLHRTVHHKNKCAASHITCW